MLRLLAYFAAFIMGFGKFFVKVYPEYLDAYAKFKNKKLIKIRCVKWFFSTTNFFGKKEYIGRMSFLVQIIIKTYYVSYIVIAILDAFIFESRIVWKIMLGSVFAICVLGIINASFLVISVNRITKTNTYKELKELEKVHGRTNDFIPNQIEK